MKTKAIQLTLATVLTLASITSAWAADNKARAAKQPTPPSADLRKELTAPVGGEFAIAGEALRSGTQQDFGGMSGNANGLDGMPSATGAPSIYPNPGVPSGY